MLKYIETDSILHKLNSTIKLLLIIGVSIYIFTIKDYRILHIVFGISLMLLFLTKISVMDYVRAIKSSVSIVIITFVLNLFFSSVSYSFMISYRIFIMLIFTFIVTFTTKSMDMVYAITNIMYPIKLFGINTKEISLMIGIGINFMPILKNEYISIKEAQIAKGYMPSFLKIKQYCICIFVPYLTNCFKRVDDISVALQAKGYEE